MLSSFMKVLGGAALAFALSVTQSACKSNAAQAVPPNAQQQTSLNKLHQRCAPAATFNGGQLKNLAALRKKKFTFTCDEMKQTCESNYVSEMCKGMMLVTSIENAYQRVCRSSRTASSSKACTKLSAACNGKGFESPECTSAIAPYNR